MDYLQNEGELGRREINHHGMKVSVNTSDKKSNKLFSPADSASYVNYSAALSICCQERIAHSTNHIFGCVLVLWVVLLF